MINAKKALWMIPVYIICFFLVSCAGPQSGSGVANGDSDGQDCSSCFAGTLEVTLSSTGPRKVGFEVTPTCNNDTDYLICDVSIFNNKVPDPTFIPNVSPLIYSWQTAAYCNDTNYLPSGKFGNNAIDCQFFCDTPDEPCVWITVKCLNTTQGTNLTISTMPENVNCSSL